MSLEFKIQYLILSLKAMYGDRYRAGFGNCLRFGLVCYSIFPDVSLFYDSDDVTVELGGIFFDIDGIWYNSKENKDRLVDLSTYGLDHILRSFSGLLNKQDISVLIRYFSEKNNGTQRN